MDLAPIVQLQAIYYIKCAIANGAINRNIDNRYRWMLLHSQPVRQMLHLCICELLFDLNGISIL